MINFIGTVFELGFPRVCIGNGPRNTDLTFHSCASPDVFENDYVTVLIAFPADQTSAGTVYSEDDCEEVGVYGGTLEYAIATSCPCAKRFWEVLVPNLPVLQDPLWTVRVMRGSPSSCLPMLIGQNSILKGPCHRTNVTGGIKEIYD